jgi:hypothetical protein
VRRLTWREWGVCIALGVILGLLVRPRHARTSSDFISREELAPTIFAVAVSVVLTFGAYLWLVRRERN